MLANIIRAVGNLHITMDVYMLSIRSLLTLFVAVAVLAVVFDVAVVLAIGDVEILFICLSLSFSSI